MSSIDLRREAEAHRLWQHRLRSSISQGFRLDPVEAANHARCKIGQWMADEGQRHKDLPEFAAACDAHVRFHVCAAAAIECAAALGVPEALTLLAADSSFARAAAECAEALERLGTAIAAASRARRA